MTRWDREKRRCISDRSCHRFRVDRHEREEQCQNGDAKPSFDCRTYDECSGGRFIKVSCLAYPNPRLKGE